MRDSWGYGFCMSNWYVVVAVANDLMPLPLSCYWLQIVDWFVVSLVAVATDLMPLPLSCYWLQIVQMIIG